MAEPIKDFSPVRPPEPLLDRSFGRTDEQVLGKGKDMVGGWGKNYFENIRVANELRKLQLTDLDRLNQNLPEGEQVRLISPDSMETVGVGGAEYPKVPGSEFCAFFVGMLTSAGGKEDLVAVRPDGYCFRFTDPDPRLSDTSHPVTIETTSLPDRQGETRPLVKGVMGQNLRVSYQGYQIAFDGNTGPFGAISNWLKDTRALVDSGKV